MKRINLYIAGIALLLLISACREEHVAPINQLVKDLFCFKEGSEWTYYDSVSRTTQKMVVTNYKTTRAAPTPNGRGKVYDWAECIEMDIIVENTKKKVRLQSDIDQDNTLMKGVSYIYPPIGQPLVIGCDQNNSFTPSAKYLDTYIVSEITYFDVYVFNEHGVTYYVSKHTGFIRCVYNNNFDWVLIDKKVQQ